MDKTNKNQANKNNTTNKHIQAPIPVFGLKVHGLKRNRHKSPGRVGCDRGYFQRPDSGGQGAVRMRRVLPFLGSPPLPRSGPRLFFILLFLVSFCFFYLETCRVCLHFLPTPSHICKQVPPLPNKQRGKKKETRSWLPLVALQRSHASGNLQKPCQWMNILGAMHSLAESNHLRL